jgi:hypothetical protein
VLLALPLSAIDKLSLAQRLRDIGQLEGATRTAKKT